jgi:aubergine-like protein
LKDKKGSDGKEVALRTNHFRLMPNRNFNLACYSLTFNPDGTGVELWPTALKKYFVYQQRDFLGGYLFDGTNIYLTKDIGDTTVKTVKTRGEPEEEVTMTIKFVRRVEMTDDLAFQVLNLILRQGMRGLNLQLVGRNFYDPAAAVSHYCSQIFYSVIQLIN